MSRVTSSRGSLFHAGELALQRDAGVAERMESLGARAIRAHMPGQHRAFFALLPFVVVGSIDEQAQPTASLLSAPPGFAWSPAPERLRIDALPLHGDPLEQNLSNGAPLAVLGFQAHTHRRNRVNGRVSERDSSGFEVAVEQSFGNCPKYIQPREAYFAGKRSPEAPRVSAHLDPSQRALISAADTFFVASAHPNARGEAPAEGVDVSHRGGPPGFASFIDEDRFVIADYAGNNLFMTLGNMLLNDAVGLLFIDFARGDLLQVHARADVVTGSHPRVSPADSGRLVRFRVTQARFFAATSFLRFVMMPPGK